MKQSSVNLKIKNSIAQEEKPVITTKLIILQICSSGLDFNDQQNVIKSLEEAR